MEISTEMIENNVKTDDLDIKFLKEIRKKYCSLYETQTLCDVTLIAGNDKQRIPAHRAWLAAASSYFHVTFTADFMDKHQDEVILNEINGDELKTVIDFCYTCCIDVNEANVFALLQTASRMEFVSIELKCADFIQQTLSISNCLSICAAIEPFINFKKLYEIVWKFIDKNYVDIVEHSNEFLQLNEGVLLKLLKRDSLNVWSEEQVFNSLVKWVEHDAELRKCHVSELLTAIRWTLLTQKFFFTRAVRFCEKFNCSKAEIIFNSESTKPRVGVIQKRYIAIGNYLPTPESNGLAEIYCPAFDKWSVFNDFTLDTTRKRFCSVIHNDELYILGGKNTDEMDVTVASVRKYNFVTKESQAIQPMNKARCMFGAIVANNYIYVAGGLGLSSVERFDPKTGEWLEVASMSHRRSHFPLAFFNQRVFAVGGFESSRVLTSAEYYDDFENKWKSVSPMNHIRYAHSLFVYNNRLYVVGGSSAIEFYDLSVDKWIEIETLSVPRVAFGIIHLEDIIIIAGGYDNKKGQQESILRIDLKTNKAEHLASTIKRTYFSFLEYPPTIPML